MDHRLFKKFIKWEKRGLIISPQKQKWWMRSHAMTPTVDHIEDNLYRIYFSGRDDKNRSQIGSAVIEVKGGDLCLVEFAEEPAMTIGELGCFDDNGVTPSCVLTVGCRKFLYYIGWNQGATVRMHLFGGLAISDNNGLGFHRYSKAPIIERNRVNPLLNTSPFVLYDSGVWRMYFVAGVEWVHKDLPRYNIQYAESSNGFDWVQEGHVCINFASPEEVALARPYVVLDDGVYKMWFCHKGAEYRMGYAESLDGKNWIRCDDFAGLTVSSSGWDDTMVAYPCVFKHDEYFYMLYNGNTYGRDGVGWAAFRDA